MDNWIIAKQSVSAKPFNLSLKCFSQRSAQDSNGKKLNCAELSKSVFERQRKELKRELH